MGSDSCRFVSLALDACDDFRLFSEKRQNHLPGIRGCIEKSDV